MRRTNSIHKVVFLVTGNIHKFHEARQILSTAGLSTAMLQKVEKTEIQNDDLRKIAKTSATAACNQCNLPIVVEDAGLFIPALGGFPGPYSDYVFRTIGNDDILKLMEDADDRTGIFQSVVAFFGFGLGQPKCFVGECPGRIATEQLGRRGFGFDPIFVPVGSTRTFGEMKFQNKNQYSHRSSAFRKFAHWYNGFQASQKF